MEFTIDYLDLALPMTNRKITKIEQFIHNCYFTNQFRHNMHGENPQLNSIIHLVISLGIHLGKQDKNNPPHAGISQEVFYNFEYIKNQNNDILGIIGANKNNSSNLQNFKRLDEKYNQIKQLLKKLSN